MDIFWVWISAIVIFMIGVSSIMSWIMSFTNIPAIIADVLLGLTNSKIAILLIMNLLLLVQDGLSLESP